MIDGHGTHLFDEKSKKIFNTFVTMSKIQIHRISPDLSWLRGV